MVCGGASTLRRGSRQCCLLGRMVRIWTEFSPPRSEVRVWGVRLISGTLKLTYREAQV
jgi:hypothetical protein